jgi:hypothetical protein
MRRRTGPPIRVLLLGAAVLSTLGVVDAADAADTENAADAAEARRPRFSIALEAGGLDNLDSGRMAHVDGEPGGASTGWKGMGQFGLGAAFEVARGVLLDLTLRDVDFDFGADVDSGSGEGTTHAVQIVDGEAEYLQLACWFDLGRLKGEPEFFFAPGRSSRARVALGLDLGYMRPESVRIPDEARIDLGAAEVEKAGATLAGLGGRFDFRIGRSRFTIGAKFTLQWTVAGELFKVQTDTGSPYRGTTAAFRGIDFVVLVAYHF